MTDNNDENKYDTRIYVDFNELPDETKKALWAEWIKKYPQEDRMRKIARFAPLIFAVITALFIIASAIVAIANGFDISCIVLLSCGVVSLVMCVILNEWGARLLYDQSARYADWLKNEKNIRAELKPKRSRKKDK